MLTAGTSTAVPSLFQAGSVLSPESSVLGSPPAPSSPPNPARSPAAPEALSDLPLESRCCSPPSCPPKPTSPDGTPCHSPRTKDTDFPVPGLLLSKESSGWGWAEPQGGSGASSAAPEGESDKVPRGSGPAVTPLAKATSTEPPEAPQARCPAEEQPSPAGRQAGEGAETAWKPGTACPPGLGTKGLLPLKRQPEGTGGVGGPEP